MKKMRKFVAVVCATLMSLSSIGINAAAIDVNFDTNVTKTESEAEAKVTVWGDSNCDNDVTMDDAVTILNYVALPTKYSIGKAEGMSQKGYLQADVYRNGDGVNGMDALSIMKYKAKELESLPESYLVPPTTTTVVTTVITTTTTKAITTTTAKPTTTTTTKATTTTAKPTTTTTTKATTTMSKPTTTTTTKATTTTAKPTTTTTTKATTTTAKPTTSTTTKATTTTAKPTTTTTTKATTTTAKPTTTTTTKATTTTTSTTTTTTSTSTTTSTTTTTTVPNDWTPPQKADLIHEGEQIDDDTYNILINTAEMFNIDRYEIIWSHHPIAYAYAAPDAYFCMREGFAYGFGIQLIPSSDISEVCPGMKKLKASTYKMNNDYLAYRPLVAADDTEDVLSSYEVTIDAYKEDKVIIAGINKIIEPDTDPGSSLYMSDLEFGNEYNVFNFIGWYLIPIDEEGNQILELNTAEHNTSVTPAAEIEYWFTNVELEGEVAPIVRWLFNEFVFTARQFNMPDFKVVYNNNHDEPLLYGFTRGTNLDLFNLGKGTVQIIPTSEIVNVIDVEARCVDVADYEYYLNEVANPYYYVTLGENDRRDLDENAFYIWSKNDSYNVYFLVPLDEDGNEDLRLYVTR